MSGVRKRWRQVAARDPVLERFGRFLMQESSLFASERATRGGPPRLCYHNMLSY